MIIEETKLRYITGGFSVTSAFINSIVKVFELIIDLGKTVGSIMRRKTDGTYCKS